MLALSICRLIQVFTPRIKVLEGQYNNDTFSPMTSQINGDSIARSIACSGDQQVSALLTCCDEIHLWLANSPRKGVIMCNPLPWWRHPMETLCALLAICAGNSPVPVNSPHKGQWRGALLGFFICVWINGWVNNREAGDLRCYRSHYDVTVMTMPLRHQNLDWKWPLRPDLKSSV